MLERIYNFNKIIKKDKVLIVYGPRRVGKTTLLNIFLKDTKLKYKLDSGDNIRTRRVLGSQDFQQIKEYSEGYELIAIDEAQQIPNIGMGLKILVDQTPGLRVIATGSSSFELSQKIGEPLTGRKKTIILFPLSQIELRDRFNKYELRENLENFLIFGAYPEIITATGRKAKIEILEELVNSYLLKDILILDKVKSSQQLFDLLKLIAFQVGSEVSLNEVAAQIKLDVKTVGRYLDILEKSFIIKRVGGFSRNLRKEVTSKAKYYFLDNGIRNALISQYNKLDDRNDIGVLFENFLISERLKRNAYKNKSVPVYFWRTYDGQEIDLIEERSGELNAYEIKWQEKKIKAPKDWSAKYPKSSYAIVHQDNYLDFVM